ncbi:ninjurin-2 isoform X2 [Nilaparvata lugens]|nr:ninjurin-2 isoform X2 [Nilaparvata lugens]
MEPNGGGREPLNPGVGLPNGFPEDPAFIPPDSRSPDINVYQQKKTLAQGMMDLALFSANANQLRFMLEQHSVTNVRFFYAVTTGIIISILLQIAVALGLIWNSRYNVKKDGQIHRANQANNCTLIGIFFITIINIFISAFGIPSYERPSLEKMQQISLPPDVNETSSVL